MTKNEQLAVDRLLDALEVCSTREQRRAAVLRSLNPVEHVTQDDGKYSYDDFVEEFWSYNPAQHGGMPELGYTALALAGEAGEVCEKVKKAYRESDGAVEKDSFAKELGDVRFYLVKLSHLIGLTSDDVDCKNVEKLRDRKLRGKMHGNGDNR